MTLSDRVVVLRRGVVQQVAPPREVYERPDNVFVARLLRLAADEPRAARRRSAAKAPRDGLALGVRPEDVSVGAGDAPEGSVAASSTSSSPWARRRA